MNKRWSELSTGTRRRIVLSGAIQLALMMAALVDLWRRSEEEIRGKKPLWIAATFVNFIGPIAYFLFGRRR